LQLARLVRQPAVVHVADPLEHSFISKWRNESVVDELLAVEGGRQIFWCIAVHRHARRTQALKQREHQREARADAAIAAYAQRKEASEAGRQQRQAEVAAAKEATRQRNITALETALLKVHVWP
jgi:hypothetical protein